MPCAHWTSFSNAVKKKLRRIFSPELHLRSSRDNSGIHEKMFENEVHCCLFVVVSVAMVRELWSSDAVCKCCYGDAA